jgi:gamma-glutamyltranspeptidase/glutathione hydrolase
MPLREAVHATRIHHQWTPDKISYEADSLDADVKQQLSGLGHKLAPIETIGDVQAAQRLPNGALVGASDSRGEGKAAVP